MNIRVYEQSGAPGRQCALPKASKVIRKWCGTDPKTHAFPGAVALVSKQRKILMHEAFGFMRLSPDPVPMSVDSVFDLASLTKAVATTTAALVLIDEGEIGLDDSLGYFAPCLSDHPLGDVRILHLLTQTLGLTGWVPLFKIGARRDDIPSFMRGVELCWPPGTRVQYSCPGFILLGWVIEKVSGMRLDEFTRERVFVPLEMKDTMFLPLDRPVPDSIGERLVPTEPRSVTLRGREITEAFAKLEIEASMPDGTHSTGNYRLHDLQREWSLRHIAGDIPCGVVHDENAAWLGGVAGNAGLFSTARDLVKLGEMYLNEGVYNGRRILGNSAIRIATRDWTGGLPGNDHRGLGWQFATPGGPLGDLTSPGCFGHTGFTGTVIWIDPKHEIVAVLLTNRLQFTRSNQHILRVRRLFINAVFTDVCNL